MEQLQVSLLYLNASVAQGERLVLVEVSVVYVEDGVRERVDVHHDCLDAEWRWLLEGERLLNRDGKREESILVWWYWEKVWCSSDQNNLVGLVPPGVCLGKGNLGSLVEDV